MSKHTPGPWHIYGLPTQARILGPKGEAVAACRAKYRDREHAAIRDANARLIAAAPELYEACRSALLALNTSDQSWDAKQQRSEWARKALLAALAKVES